MSKKIGLGWIWARSFNGVKVETLRALYRAMMAETLSQRPNMTAKRLEAHIRLNVENDKEIGRRTHGCSDPALWIRALASQYIMVYTVQTFIPPSPETLAWGGFLGGETINDTTEAHERLNALVARFVPGVSEVVGGFS